MERPREKRRRYEDACGTAHALELVGDRWALLVMRELMLGPRRFGDLKADLPGISANILTQRLEELEAAGLVVRQKLPPPASVRVYALTAWGLEAEPVIQTLGRWAARSPAHDPTLPISPVSLMLSFRTMFDPARAAAFAATIGFVLGDQSFVVRIRDGMLETERGDPHGSDAVFEGGAAQVAACVYGGQPVAAMVKDGALRVHGDRAIAERFCALFPLPPKVS